MKPTTMRRRTRAREVALQFLYQLDLRGEEAMEGLDAFLREEAEEPEVREFALRLIVGAKRAREEADQKLRHVTRNWDLKRMAAIDRNILRMAVFELLHCPDIPPKVTINEAIELGKKYSTANSGAFVNGILDRVRLDAEAAVRDGKAAGAGAAGEAAADEAAAGPCSSKADTPGKADARSKGHAGRTGASSPPREG